MQMPDGTLVERHKGTPQGGVISPVLANLFMHYVFDAWITRKFPDLLWCRYADDGLVHCKTEQQAHAIKTALDCRFKECKLEMHPEKTKIVYCKDKNRKGNYENTKLDFLGYTFRPRTVENKQKQLFVSFTAAVSIKAQKAMRQAIRARNLHSRTDLELGDLSRMLNPVLRGWKQYYGKYSPSSMIPTFKYFNSILRTWAMRKYKRLKRHKIRASLFIIKCAKEQPGLFIHWQQGMVGMTI